MKAVANTPASTSTAAKKEQKAAVTPVPSSPWIVQPLSVIEGPVIQRKASCACGGDCPRCLQQAVPEMIQTKLNISTPGDQYEQEADRVADQVMRMSYPILQRQCSGCSDIRTQATNDEMEPSIRRQANGGGGPSSVTADFTNRLGAGMPLDT